MDDYLEFCQKAGKAAERPFSGKFVARINPTLHRALTALALVSGKSLNQFLNDALEAMAKEAVPTLTAVPSLSALRASKKKASRQSRPENSGKAKATRERTLRVAKPRRISSREST